MKTTTQELKQYITRLFQLSNEESWECEVLDEVAENILPHALLMVPPYSSHTRNLHLLQQ